MVQAVVPPGAVRLQVAFKTDPGLDPDKQVNEDACGQAELASGRVLVVCDGMGGHVSGREASQRAIQTILREMDQRTLPPGPSLKHAIEQAGRAVYELGGSEQNRLRPGSTCVALFVHAAGTEVAHVGDSRAYMIRASQIFSLTRDHSMVQEMIDAGVLTPQEAAAHPDANKITRALGMASEVDVELMPTPIVNAAGDVFALATDGLCDLVAPAEILAVVQQALAFRGLSFACDQLVALANARGGHDNITVLLAQVTEIASTGGGRATVPDAVAADAMSKPAVTVPQIPAVTGHGPAVPAGPAPTMIDESLAADASVSMVSAPAQPFSSSAWLQPSGPESSRAGRSKSLRRGMDPGVLALAIGLVVLGVIIVVLSMIWVFSRSGQQDVPDGQDATVRSPGVTTSTVEVVPSAPSRPKASSSSLLLPPGSAPTTTRRQNRPVNH